MSEASSGGIKDFAARGAWQLALFGYHEAPFKCRQSYDRLFPSGRLMAILDYKKWLKSQLLKKSLSFFLIIYVIVVYWPCLGASEEVDTTDKEISISVLVGDTLMSICKKYLQDLKDCLSIAKLNHITDPNKIYPDQSLVIPAYMLKSIPFDGVMTFLKGNVQRQSQPGESWIDLHLNDRIQPGNRIKTGAASAVEIAFLDEATVFMKANTVMGLVQSQKRGPLALVLELFLEVGNLLTTIKRATGQDSRFNIRTPSATTAARGTIFRVGVDQADHTRAGTLEGEIGVAAMNQVVRVSEGLGTYVKPGEPPLPPRPLLPAPAPLDVQPLYRQPPVQLRFESVAGAQAYHVAVTRDRAGKDVVQEAILSPSAVFDLSALDDGVWFLHTVSMDEVQLPGLPSEPKAITLRLQTPRPPALQAPAEAATYTISAVPFTWRQAADAVRYHLQLAEDRDFTTLVEDRADIIGLSSITPLLEAKTYYARLRSIAADDYPGPWSAPVQFTIASAPVPTIADVEGESSRLRIQWNQVGPGMTYHLQMASTPSFNDLLLDQLVSTPAATISKPATAGTYYVRASAIDAQGHEGRFSPPQPFDVKRFPYGLAALAFIITVGIILWIVKRALSRG